VVHARNDKDESVPSTYIYLLMYLDIDCLVDYVGIPIYSLRVELFFSNRCPAENRSPSASGKLSSPHRTTTVSSVPTLRRRRRDGAASSTLLPVTLAGAIIHQLHQLNRSSTHVVLSGVDQGHDTLPDQERQRQFFSK